jgi:crossover junction endodeoxyribonuclease RuvC
VPAHRGPTQTVRTTRILGIDPGSRLTGFGVLDVIGNQLKLVAQGTLKLSRTGGRQQISLEERLLSIHEGLTEIILAHKPQVMSIERVFFAKNAVSALKLGQARGAAILSGAIHGLDIVEYSPSEVKASIVGHGQADKEQVARMVQLLVGAQTFATSDASDGVALAICHAHRLAGSGTASSAYARALQGGASHGRSRNRKLSLAEAVGAKLPDSPPPKRR